MGNRYEALQTKTAYHVFNRGLNKQTLFYKVADYHRFLETITRYKMRYKGIQISAYCLLPNHFHFLLRDEEADSSNSKQPLNIGVRTAAKPNKICEISDFMQKIQQSYALYFNKEYGDSVKKGLKSPVFEGRFKAKEVLDEAYLVQLVTYIEHNAVKHELVKKIEDWPYTSWESGKTFDIEEDFFTDFD